MARPHIVLARLAGMLAAGLTTTVAMGQACSIFREGVPDFDQERASLPNGGQMYCVPTSASNLLAYISNNGLPQVYGGPFNWQLAQYYDYVSTQINYVANEMDTDSADGTGGDDARDGLEDVLDARASGKFTVSTYYGHVKLSDLYTFMADNRLIMICYGFYKFDAGESEWYRDGGHCVTLTGMLNACQTSGSTIRYRDPDDDSTTASQSTFKSRVTRADAVSLVMSGGVATRYWLRDLSPASPTRRCLDRHITIRSRYAIWPHPTNGSWVRYDLVNSIRAQGTTAGVFFTPSSQPIEQAVLSPLGNTLYFTTVIPNSPDVLPPLYKQDVVTGESVFLGFLDRYTPLVTDRFGDLYMYRAGAIRRYDTAGPTIVEQALWRPANGLAPDALQWDDRRDLLIAVGGGVGLQLLNRSLQGQGHYALPAGVTLNGIARFDISPAGTFVIGSSNSPTLYHVRFNNVQPRLDLTQTLTIPGVTSVKAIQITESGTGRLCVMTNAGVREYVRDATGNWVPAADPQCGNVPAGNFMALSKGRTNFQFGVHDQPGWRDEVVVETAPSIADCPADIDLNGILHVNDIFAFLNMWFAQARASDFDVSGTYSTTDIFAYLNAWFAGC